MIPMEGYTHDICPFCHQMIMPIRFGGRNHLQSHLIPKANNLLNRGYSLKEINNQLQTKGLDLFINIPYAVCDLTKDDPIIINDKKYFIYRINHNQSLELKSKDSHTNINLTLSMLDSKIRSNKKEGKNG